MRSIVLSGLTFGTYVFLSFCVLLSGNAEHSVQAHSYGTLKTFSPVGSVTSKPKFVKRTQRWTQDEMERLLELREQQLPWEEIHEHFPERTWQAIVIKHSKLTRGRSVPKKKRGRLWTEEENEFLLKLVEAEVSWMEIAGNFPERTVAGIRSHYRYLRRGLLRPKLYKAPWTAAEDKLLIELEEEGRPWKERVVLFDNRSLPAMQQRLKIIKPERIPIGNFTPEEDDTIVEALMSGKSMKEIAQSLGRSERGVQRRIKKLEKSNRLYPTPQIVSGRHYAEADLERIDKMAKEGMSYEEIAPSFRGRSAQAVRFAHKRYKNRKEREGQERVRRSVRLSITERDIKVQI